MVHIGITGLIKIELQDFRLHEIALAHKCHKQHEQGRALHAARSLVARVHGHELQDLAQLVDNQASYQ